MEQLLKKTVHLENGTAKVVDGKPKQKLKPLLKLTPVTIGL
jgi:hypothetical protein